MLLNNQVWVTNDLLVSIGLMYVVITLMVDDIDQFALFDFFGLVLLLRRYWYGMHLPSILHLDCGLVLTAQDHIYQATDSH